MDQQVDFSSNSRKSKASESVLRIYNPDLINSVTITIGQISQLRGMRIIELSVVAEYRRTIVGESDSYILDKDDDGINMGFIFNLPHREMKPKFWKEICGNQILLTFYKVVKPPTPVVSTTTLETVISSTPTKSSKSTKGSKKKPASITLNISEIKKKDKVKINEKSTKKILEDLKTSRTTKSSKSSTKEKRCSIIRKSLPFRPDILGRCNIDLLPILQERTPYNMTVKIQQEKIVLGQDMVTYDNLPEVQIEIKTEHEIPLLERYNILTVTMEAVYNIDPGMKNLQAAITLPKLDPPPARPPPPSTLNLSRETQEFTPLDLQKKDDNKAKSKKRSKGSIAYNLPKPKSNIGKEDNARKSDVTESILATSPPPPSEHAFIFKHGTRNDKENLLTKKKWESFTEHEGRAAFSPYDLEPTISDIRNPLRLDLESIYGKIPRIEWNCVYRNWVMAEESKPFIKYLKYKKYPIEFSVQYNKPNSTNWHAMAIPDLKALSWPGVTRVRIATPLYAYDPELMELHCDINYSLFGEPPQDNPVETEPEPENEKKGANKSKGSSKSSKKSRKDIKENPRPVSRPPLEPKEPPPLVQLFNEEGKPMFVIIQLQLKNPLIPLRSLEQLEREIDHLIPVREELPKVLMDAQTAELLYKEAIQGSIDYVLKDYTTFTKSQAYKSHQTMSFSDYVYQILQHLKLTGTYQHIKSLLVHRVAHLVHQKFMIGTKIETDNDYEMLMAEVYTYITKEAHCIINTELALDIGLKINCDHGVSAEHMWQFATEAEAIGDKQRAKILHLERIARNKKDADRWFDYAIYLAANKELEKATICTLEALSLDSRHRLSLLLHSILLVRQDNNCSVRDAENILLGLTTFYPLFTEGWVALHLLYLTTGDYVGADATIQYAIECNGNAEALSLPTEMEGRDYFYWTWIADEKEELFIQAAVFFLKLQICDFAELSLAEYINHGGPKDDKYYYLLAVHHFMLRRYEDAITHIQCAINIRQEDHQLCALLGHCYYAVGKPKGAERNYDFVVNSMDRPNNISLVYYNLGQLLFYRNNLARARTLYFTSVKYFPTPASWLGVGIASYKLRDFLTAEKALREATTLDRNLSRGWGYLALINLNLSRYNEFVQCYRIAKRTNLTDTCILEEIEFVRQQKHFPDPGCLCHESKE